jgi:macrolide transport system ATP-binding/permease protein
MSISDLLSEAFAGLFARPARAILTVLGTVLGIASLVATLGVSKTAGNQIVGRFDELAATEVVVEPAETSGGLADVLPWSAEERLSRLNGVTAAGTLSDVSIGAALVSAVPVVDPRGQTAFSMSVRAASPGLFDAVRATVGAGRWFDSGHSDRRDAVAVLGRTAAERLGISRVDHAPAIFVGDRLYVVIGIIDDVAREPALLDSIIIPEGTARSDWGLVSPGRVQIETEVGAAQLIASQAALALAPNQPGLLSVAKPPEPRRAREGAQSDIESLFAVLGGVSLLVGAIGIANVTLVSVLERVGEIGLRRALGARRRHIALQFLAESTAMGLLGGIVGASAGVLVVVGVSASRSWTPVLDPLLPIVAPLAGAAVGLVAGAYPSLRAAKLEPVDALRSGT